MCSWSGYCWIVQQVEVRHRSEGKQRAKGECKKKAYVSSMREAARNLQIVQVKEKGPPVGKPAACLAMRED
jgi:hypothetical protein